MSAFETYVNQAGEHVTKWESTKHPDNPNFMQTVYWIVWEKPDGRITICYHLGSGSKHVFVYGLTKNRVIELYGPEYY